MPAYQPDVRPSDIVEQCSSFETLVWMPDAITDGDLLMFLRAARFDLTHRLLFILSICQCHCSHKLTVTHTRTHACTHTHTFNGPLSRTTWVSRYQKGKTNLDFTEARDNESQWHQLSSGRMPFPPPNQQRQSTYDIIRKLSIMVQYSD